MSYFKKFEDWNTKYNHLSVDVEAYTIIKDLLTSADEDVASLHDYYGKQSSQIKEELEDLYAEVHNAFLLMELDEEIIVNLKATIWVLSIGLALIVGTYGYFIFRAVTGQLTSSEIYDIIYIVRKK